MPGPVGAETELVDVLNETTVKTDDPNVNSQLLRTQPDL